MVLRYENDTKILTFFERTFFLFQNKTVLIQFSCTNYREKLKFVNLLEAYKIKTYYKYKILSFSKIIWVLHPQS